MEPDVFSFRNML